MDCKYIGNSICCGTYSLIHLLERDMDVDLFELTTGVPFGIKGSIEEGRLLTTFINPNYGLETGMKIWGIRGRKYHYKNKQQAWEKLMEVLADEGSIILGPVDMLKLSYFPLSTLYTGMDHYVCVKKQDDTHVLIKDSEGYLAERESMDILARMWDTRNVIEAEGEYTFRAIDKSSGKLPERKELLTKAFILMAQNIFKAEQACYGSHTFMRIVKYIGNAANTRWHTGMMYDLTHLLQRKVITKQMLQELADLNAYEVYTRLLRCICEQIDILPLLYRNVEEGKLPSRSLLTDMQNTERELYNIFKSIE